MPRELLIVDHRPLERLGEHLALGRIVDRPHAADETPPQPMPILRHHLPQLHPHPQRHRPQHPAPALAPGQLV
jgi:hypothetical protein